MLKPLKVYNRNTWDLDYKPSTGVTAGGRSAANQT